MTTGSTKAALQRPAILDRLHDILVLLLVVLRPLCWDGAPGQIADLVWQGLAVGGLTIAALERAAGLSSAWRWSWRGAAALGLILALIPAVFGAAEASPAWCRWTGWVACLAAAAYLVQVLPGRTRLALAGLTAGVTITATLGLAQPWLVLPAMAKAQQAGDAVFQGMPGDPGAIAERIANGGAFATFTLANQFGAYLALVLPLLLGMAWTCRGLARWSMVVVGIIVLAALAETGAKGAWLALAAGLAAGWTVAWPGRWWRWLPLALGVVGFAVLLHRGFAQASIDVRLGYWHSAMTLIQERPLTGHGLGGFAAEQPRVMQIGDEPTRFAHNEVLEAAVAGGWLVAGLLVIALLAMAWPRRADSLAASTESSPPRQLALVLIVAIPYLALLGAFDGNLGWWPGGNGLGGIMLWSMVLGLVAGGTAWVCWRADPPPMWAWTAGLTAVALKALIDFDLHAGGVIGSAVLVAAAAPGAVHCATSMMSRVLPVVAAVVCTIVVLLGATTALRLSEAEDWIAAARGCSDPQIAQAVALRLGLPPQQTTQAVAAQAALRAWQLAEGAPGIQASALEFMPPAPEVLEMADTLAKASSHSAAIALRHARLLAAAHYRAEAIAEAERATRCAPTAPRVLDVAADVIERCGTGQPEQLARVAQLRSEAQRLAPLVHPGMRH